MAYLQEKRNIKVLSKFLKGRDLLNDLDGRILLNGSYING